MSRLSRLSPLLVSPLVVLALAPALFAQEDGALAGAMRRFGSAEFRHGADVKHLAYSRDGKTIAAGGGDGIHLWDPDTGARILTFGEEPGRYGISVWGMQFSDDGSILGATWGAGARFWDAKTGREIRRIESRNSVRFAFLPKGNLIGMVEGDDLKIVDVVTGKEVRRLRVGLDIPRRKVEVKLNNLPAAKPKKGAETPKNPPKVEETKKADTPKRDGPADDSRAGVDETVVFTRDGDRVATIQANVIVLWDMKSGKEVLRLRNDKHQEEHYGPIAFSPDGRTLVSHGWWWGSFDTSSLIAWTFGTLRLWDTQTGAVRTMLREGKPVFTTAVAFAPDGATFATAYQNRIYLWNAATGEHIRDCAEVQSPLHDLAFSPDGTRLAAVGGSSVFQWDTATGERRGAPRAQHEATVSVLAFSPDGRTLTSADAVGDIRLWDRTTGESIGRLAHKGGVSAFGYSRDGDRLAVVGFDKSATIFDMPAKRVLHRFDTEVYHLGHVAFMPDNKTLVLGQTIAEKGKPESIESLQLWDLTTAKKRPWRPEDDSRATTIAAATRDDGERNASAIALSADGTIAVFQAGKWPPGKNYETRLIVYDARRGTRLSEFSVPGFGDRMFAISPDNRFVAGRPRLAFGDELAADRHIRIWEIASGKEVWMTPMKKRIDVSSLAFAPEMKTIAAGMSDSTISEWSLGPFAKDARAENLANDALKSLWIRLAGDDARNAFSAMQTLAQDPVRSVPFLVGQLDFPKIADPKRLRQLIRDLSADEFPVRERATAELLRLGDLAEPALCEEVANAASTESLRRSNAILAKRPPRMGKSPEHVRAIRAIVVLEWIGTPAAREGLRLLAANEFWWTAPEAAATIERLSLRKLDSDPPPRPIR
jgi:WD40 repeat protein